jgi:hypothetical protein
VAAANLQSATAKHLMNVSHDKNNESTASIVPTAGRTAAILRQQGSRRRCNSRETGARGEPHPATFKNGHLPIKTGRTSWPTLLRGAGRL